MRPPRVRMQALTAFQTASWLVSMVLVACGDFLVEPSTPQVIIEPQAFVLRVGDSLLVEAQAVGEDGFIDNPTLFAEFDRPIATIDLENLSVRGIAPGEGELMLTEATESGVGFARLRVIEEFIWLAAGAHHTCGLAGLGRLYCWGDNTYGQLGRVGPDSNVPVRIAPGTDWSGIRASGSFPQWNDRRLAAGSFHTCAITTTDPGLHPSLGPLKCWGRGTSGQLGTGDYADAATPTLVAGGHVFSSVSAGPEHTCAIASRFPNDDASGGGSRPYGVYCWGRNDRGQLGDGTTQDRPVPTPIGVDARFQWISVSDHSCAVTIDGALYCWGPNEMGQLGDGTTTDRSTPVLIGGATEFENVEAGPQSTCGIVASNLLCWGRNVGHILGEDVGEFSPTPVVAPRLALRLTTAAFVTMAPVALGGEGESGYGCASMQVSANAVSYTACWGANGNGQLGIGSTSGAPVSPDTLQIAPLVSLHAGAAHTCALTVSGRAYCWGANAEGQLGNGTNVDALVPSRLLVEGDPLATARQRVEQSGAGHHP